MAGSASVLGRDPTVHTDWHRIDDRFVPLRASDLVELLAKDAARFGATPELIREVSDRLLDLADQELLVFQRRLTDLYAPFNPDRETMPFGDIEAGRNDARRDELLQRLSYLLNKANFAQLSDIEIKTVVEAATSHGYKIRLRAERVRRIDLWVRGRGTITRRISRTWRHPIAGETRVLSVYRRLVVVAQLRDDLNVIVKMFKDIPQEDVEALLPNAEIAMNWFDRLVLIGGGAGAFAPTLIKLFNMVAIVLTKALWTLVVGGATLAFRSALGYRRARKHRDWQRVQHLYFQNLTNNAGTLSALTTMIAQEEAKEALLGLAFAQGESGAPRTSESLGRAIDDYLLERIQADVEFDTPDAIETLDRLGLWRDRGRLVALSFEEAARRLAAQRVEDAREYHERCCIDGQCYRTTHAVFS